MNTLYYGDNLKILRDRDYFPSESVDLIYLDPPFNSNRNYNVLFKDEAGLEADSQIQAFEDTWHWPNAKMSYHELLEEADDVAEMLKSFHQFLKSSQMMAYLVMMAARLKELHRVLKPTGSLYLHCDPTASHYLKILLDTILGPQNFRSEVIWKRTGSHGGAKRWGPLHDTIFFYSKTDNFTWNRVLENYNEEYLTKFYRFHDEKGRYRLVSLTGAGTRSGDSGKEWRGVNPTDVGRHWAVPLTALREVAGEIDISKLSTQEKLDILDEHGQIYFPTKGSVPQQKRYIKDEDGVPIQDIITDILPLSSQAQERLHYPTQKPAALLERIIQASSNEGEVVLDPFAGCGTTIAAAEKLNRQWIGIDVTQLSIALLKSRLERDFGLLPKQDYKVVGEPEDLHDARILAHDPDPKNKYQFQYWALSQVRATPLGGQVGGRSGKIGSDRGIDGKKNFWDDNSGKPKTVVFQVKSGGVGVKDIRDLVGTVKREDAAIGVFITLEPPTKPMLDEAADADVYKGEHFPKLYPKIQILTIEEILAGKQIDMPPPGQFRAGVQADDQPTLGFS